MNAPRRLLLAIAPLLLCTFSASAQEAPGPPRLVLKQPIPLSAPNQHTVNYGPVTANCEPPQCSAAVPPISFPPLRLTMNRCSSCPPPGTGEPLYGPGCGPAGFGFLQHLRGRLLYDTGFFNHHPYNTTLPPFEDAQALRSARLGAEGFITDTLWYRAEVDFANGDGLQNNLNGVVEVKDVFLEQTRLPFIGNLRAGHFREPFSLEQQTEETFLTFMERSTMDRGRPIFSAPDQVQTTNTDLVPGRSTGIMLQNTMFDGRLWGATGWFRVDSDDQGFDNGDGDYAFTTRITGLPLWQENGRRLIHLGAAYSYREYREPAPGAGNLPAFTSRVATLGTPLLLNTGVIENADRADNFGTEFAAVFGPFSLQSEWAFIHIDQLAGSPDLYFWGAYIYGSYFLTGEHRRYNKCIAAFDRVVPLRNFVCRADKPGDSKIVRILVGRGAWEVALRYSIVDLSGGLFRPVDGLLPGNMTQSLEGGTGMLREWTVGLNWYWNPYARIMFNYVHTTRDSDSVGDGAVSSVLWRFQVDW